MKKRKLLSILLILSLFIGMVGIVNAEPSYAASKKIHVKKKAVTLQVGQKYQQKLIAKNGKTIKAKKVKWKSKKPSVAKINKKGKITAVRPGTAKMTAKYKGKTYKFTVKVEAGTPAQSPASNQTPQQPSTPTNNQLISLEPYFLTINYGESATVHLTTDNGQVVYYSISNNSVSVKWDGWSDDHSGTFTVTGVKPGMALLSVWDPVDTSVKAILTISVVMSKEQAISYMHDYIIENGREPQYASGIAGDYYIESASYATSDRSRIVLSTSIGSNCIHMYRIDRDDKKYVLTYNDPDEEVGITSFSIFYGSLFGTNYWGDLITEKYTAKLYGEENGIINCMKTGPSTVTDASELYKIYKTASESMEDIDLFLRTYMGFGLDTLGFKNM